MIGLSNKDKLELAQFYDYPEYKTFKKWLDNERLDIAKDLLTWPAADVVGVSRLQGRAEALKTINLEIKRISIWGSQQK